MNRARKQVAPDQSNALNRNRVLLSGATCLRARFTRLAALTPTEFKPRLQT